MGGEHQRLIRNLGLSVISLTGLMVFILGGWIVGSALSAPSSDIVPLSYLIASDNRSPASVTEKNESPQEAKRKRFFKVESLSLGCLELKPNQNLNIRSKQVRIKAKACKLGSIDLASSRVINNTNGYEATLFNLGGGHFSTDYVSLNQGDNHLILEIKNTQGQHIASEMVISYLE